MSRRTFFETMGIKEAFSGLSRAVIVVEGFLPLTEAVADRTVHTNYYLCYYLLCWEVRCDVELTGCIESISLGFVSGEPTLHLKINEKQDLIDGYDEMKKTDKLRIRIEPYKEETEND